jgi:hypothetical protein
VSAANRHRKRPWWQRQRQQLALFAPPKPPKPERPKAPPKMTRCPCGNDFPARLAAKRGTVIRCPDCLADLARRALALHQQGYPWKEVAAALGRASPGSLVTLVQKYGGEHAA